MRIELPFPPSVNHYWVRTARRVYLSEAAKRFQRWTIEAVTKAEIWADDAQVRVMTVKKFDADNKIKNGKCVVVIEEYVEEAAV